MLCYKIFLSFCGSKIAKNPKKIKVNAQRNAIMVNYLQQPDAAMESRHGDDATIRALSQFAMNLINNMQK